MMLLFESPISLLLLPTPPSLLPHIILMPIPSSQRCPHHLYFLRTPFFDRFETYLVIITGIVEIGVLLVISQSSVIRSSDEQSDGANRVKIFFKYISADIIFPSRVLFYWIISFIFFFYFFKSYISIFVHKNYFICLSDEMILF